MIWGYPHLRNLHIPSGNIIPWPSGSPLVSCSMIFPLKAEQRSSMFRLWVLYPPLGQNRIVPTLSFHSNQPRFAIQPCPPQIIFVRLHWLRLHRLRLKQIYRPELERLTSRNHQSFGSFPFFTSHIICYKTWKGAPLITYLNLMFESFRARPSRIWYHKTLWKMDGKWLRAKVIFYHMINNNQPWYLPWFTMDLPWDLPWIYHDLLWFYHDLLHLWPKDADFFWRVDAIYAIFWRFCALAAGLSAISTELAAGR